MTTVTFDSVALNHPDIKPSVKPKVGKANTVAGKKKLTPSTNTETSWQISCICTLAEYATLLGKVGYSKTLVINSTTYTDCCITSWKEKEINPSTIEVTITVEQDTT